MIAPSEDRRHICQSSRESVWEVDVGSGSGCRRARRGHRRGVDGLCRTAARHVGRSRRPARAGQRDFVRQCRHHQQRLDFAAQQSLAVEGAAEIPDQPSPGIAVESGLGGSERGMGRALSGQFGRLASPAAGGRPARADRRIAETASGMDREGGRRASHPRDRLAEGVARRCRLRRRSRSRPC